MIIITDYKSFKKKIEKWVLEKDFIIADAVDSHDGRLNVYGNVISADELTPTPTLGKIATDPDSKEAQIKRAHLQKYLDLWLSDEGMALKMHMLASQIVKNYRQCGEDLNVFVVMQPALFYAFADKLVEKFNETYVAGLACTLTRNTDKAKAKEILRWQPPHEFHKKLRKRVKQLAKELKVEDHEILDGIDGGYLD